MQWLTGSLHRKLSALLVVAIIIPILCLGYVSYSIASSITEEKAKLASLNTLRQMSAVMETIAQDAENMSIFLIGQQEIQQYLSSKQANAAAYMRMIGFLTNLAFSKTYISDIRIIPFNGNSELTNTTIFSSQLYQHVPLIHSSFWEKKTKWWSPPLDLLTSKGHLRTVSLVRPFRSMSTFEHMGMLSIGIDSGVLEHKLRNATIDSGIMLLLDEQGRLVASNASMQASARWPKVLHELDKGSEPQFIDVGEHDDRHIVVTMPVPVAPWRMYAVIPYEAFSAQNRYVLQLTVLTAGIAFIVISGAALFFVKRVTMPLIRLAHGIRKVQPDRPFERVPITSQDEIGLLESSYNRLNDNIARLTEQVKVNEARKKEADLQALQAQIQPHFLYNTLSSVQWLAWMDGNRKIADMVGALSHFLRFSLNRGLEYCPIEQEIAHVTHYLHIQAIRYPERFQFVVTLPTELEQVSTLKLLLQPLVENSLIHGVLKMPSVQVEATERCMFQNEESAVYAAAVISIEVALVDNSHIRFCVQDNGVGMDAEAIARLRAQLTEEQRSSYGVYNVQQRLRLHYGDQAQLLIESELGKGTKVTFEIPIGVNG
ncbi:cache domain-containing sensor histidine kinase [Paenibacillus sp. 481]|uniref:cache domain-containing sensor histidine kinase n=1 Tax=Paenibacillus sp. 481 TaxID=2835869 RepID=UPI001E420ACD|nr:sensor histidine kinase [Paenibacillus sp. 481]UHA72817.1 sensor histidine kinase [Paenibacillus sp. 481]